MEYHDHYRRGVITPSEVIHDALNSVKEWEKRKFRIFSSILVEEVVESARASSERWRRGEPLSVFDGVPVAFKDMMDVKGHIIYEGRNPHPSHSAEWILAKEDDLMVERLRAMGAIIFGVTIEVEGGVSPLGYNAHFQGPVSPYSWNRYSGGSSSGSAVAVATGIVPVAIGYDGGGSIRIPGKIIVPVETIKQCFCWYGVRLFS
jgi:Asp-tRNA(Asn)/Glu-tRNA(Gln) amidotransferase A subunit family amidase